jgi:shikimate dehydrogenase
MSERAQLAVMGSPIAHSKSPAIHAAAYRALGLDWAYSRHECVASELEQALALAALAWSVADDAAQRACVRARGAH